MSILYTSLFLLDIDIVTFLLNFEPSLIVPQVQCADIIIENDGIIESEEEYCLTLQNFRSDVTIEPILETCIFIEETLECVSWSNSEYSANEGDVLSLCAETHNVSEIAFTVSIILPERISKLEFPIVMINHQF